MLNKVIYRFVKEAKCYKTLKNVSPMFHLKNFNTYKIV